MVRALAALLGTEGSGLQQHRYLAGPPRLRGSTASEQVVRVWATMVEGAHGAGAGGMRRAGAGEAKLTAARAAWLAVRLRIHLFRTSSP